MDKALQLLLFRGLVLVVGLVLIPFEATWATASTTDAPCQNPPFVDGEKIRYEIRYGFLRGGDITLEIVEGPTASKRQPWSIEGRAISSKLVSVFYRVDDTIRGWIEPREFVPSRLEMQVEESGERGTRTVIYDHEEKVAHYRRNRTFHRKRGPSLLERQDDLVPQSQDALSILYFLRCLAFEPGVEQRIPLHENGKNRVARVTVGSPEEVETTLGKRLGVPLEVHVTVEGKLANQRAIRVWLEPGPRRLPVRVEADLKFGKLQALLAGYRESPKGRAEGEVAITR